MARLVLVADGSPAIQKRAQAILQEGGFEVETVSNGVAAIKKLPKLQPALVLADVSMPGKNGYEVCDYVKTSADFHHVPVLLMASDLEPYDEPRGTQVRADGIIKKPYTSHELIAMVAKFVLPDQAATSNYIPSDTLDHSASVTSPEVTTVGSEPNGTTTNHEHEIAKLSADVASLGPLLDELRRAPSAPGPPLEETAQPSPTSPFEPSPETVMGGPSEPTIERAPELPQEFARELPPFPTPDPIREAAPEINPATPESISGTDLGVPFEPVPTTPESVSETVLEASPESVSVAFELNSGTTPEATPEPSPGNILEAALEPNPVAPESVLATASEAAPEQEALPSEQAVETEPEEQAEPLPPPSPFPGGVEPAAERTLVPSLTPEIAEPVLIDELASAPVTHHSHPAVEEQHTHPVGAIHLDDFPLTGSAEGEAYMASTREATTPTAESAQAAYSAIDPRWVHLIIQKAVIKMSPLALTPEIIEELIYRLTEEIIAELNEESAGG